VLTDVLSSDRRDVPPSLLATAEGPAAVREDDAVPEVPKAAHAGSTG
jgi:hypothetical protein